MRNLGMGPAPMGRKRRWGCTGCFTRVFLILLLASVLALILPGIFYPWSYYLGGHFHLVPGWSGIARLPGPGGDYVVYIWIQPSSGGRTFNLPSFRGTGSLCTPRGERFRLRVTAGMNEKTGIDTNGKAFNVSVYQRPWYRGFVGQYDNRPALHFKGKWQNPELVMDDGGTLAAAFNPDGSLSNQRYNYYHADAKNKIPVIFHQVTGWQAWWGGCSAK